MKKKEVKHIGIEFNLSNANGIFYFPNNNELNGKTVTGISLLANSAATELTPSGLIHITDAAIASCFLTIQRDSVNLTLTVPLKHYQQQDGDRSIRKQCIDGFNPGTTYLQFVKDPGTGLFRYTVGQGVMLILDYMDDESR